MEKLAQGTKEYVVVDVTDRLGELDNLDLVTGTYDVNDENGEEMVAGASAASVSGEMKMKCMIDTTQPDLWEPGSYYLFLVLNVTPEAPRIGPLEFKVE